ncbi:MAG: hypothetical protein JWO36_3909 [Myxococcales bacterium]|nr:hypothetical protein [Myxococcales bacterium]
MGAIMDKIKGKAKEIEGRLTGDKIRQGQGRAEKAKGDVEGATSRAARKVKGEARRVKAKVNAKVDRSRAKARSRAR